ncbi:4-oxalomesaconate tautomerase [Litoricola sp.]|jgi:4-oxalomesaconate tautomerase|nr:4-oxalomesaconate tautomerase [Litorivicinus sp.]|tara:strand:+ start:582 stop:1643 length:1062 start_codon:yes stop_codon:yes gene_type:complete
MSDGIPCVWMRGGTSKGGLFLAADLPTDIIQRDQLLLEIMGSPDNRQIDGMGGADPLTSKVGIVKRSSHPDCDVDYLFLQVFVDQAIVTDSQNCGNILAAVGPFAIEQGLVPAKGDVTQVSVLMENTDQIAVLQVQTPNGKVTYKGTSAIDGVPGTSAPVTCEFKETAGSTCGALYPSGNLTDFIDGVDVTLIDNGMPVVILNASDFGVSGTESRDELDGNTELKIRLESIRLQAGPLMNLGDVTEKSVPKMSLVCKPKDGGCIATRTFIPHRCHASIGVLGAVSVATAAITPGTVAYPLAQIPDGDQKTLPVEHPTGEMTVVAYMDGDELGSAALLRTARKLFEGTVYPLEK